MAKKRIFVGMGQRNPCWPVFDVAGHDFSQSQGDGYFPQSQAVHAERAAWHAGFNTARNGKVMSMLKFSKLAMYGGVVASALCLPGCVVEVLNKQPAEELKQLSHPPGSVYTGWRVFQDKCASCHGPDATGTAGGPDLLPMVHNMGVRQFVSLVLNRYDWVFPAGQTRRDSVMRDDLIEDLMQRKQYMLTMPAWQGEPRVNAHIVDLYAYLSARAAGVQGPGRPPQ